MILFDSLEPFEGLSISDLNRYLPAIQKVDDIQMSREKMSEGLFLADGQEGLAQLPSQSIDLILADPPENSGRSSHEPATSLTLQEYYQWNETWLKESYRVLKPTGVIYLICGWRFSGMYHALLNINFQVQTRITWRNIATGDQPNPMTWRNTLSDIWFATKTTEFMFRQKPATHDPEKTESSDESEKDRPSNLWADILEVQIGLTEKTEDKPESLIERILKASSFKLNWVVDPFMRSGGVGVIAKKYGRRFIGFETNQDRLLMAMKRIDQTVRRET